MAALANVLQQHAGVLLALLRGDAGLAGDAPGAVRVPEAHAGAAGGRVSCLAPRQGKTLDLVLGENNQATGPRVVYCLGNNEDVGDGDMKRKQLDLLNEGRLMSLTHKFEDATSSCPDIEDIHDLPTSSHEAGVSSDRGEALMRIGLYVVRSLKD